MTKSRLPSASEWAMNVRCPATGWLRSGSDCAHSSFSAWQVWASMRLACSALRSRCVIDRPTRSARLKRCSFFLSVRSRQGIGIEDLERCNYVWRHRRLRCPARFLRQATPRSYDAPMPRIRWPARTATETVRIMFPVPFPLIHQYRPANRETFADET